METNIVNFLSSAAALYGFFLLCLLIGGLFTVRNGRRVELTKFQRETIEAREQRISALEDKIGDLEKSSQEKISDLQKTNLIQQHIIDTIILALKQRGQIITIDGDLVTITDSSGSSTSRKRVTTHSVTVKEEKAE